MISTRRLFLKGAERRQRRAKDEQRDGKNSEWLHFAIVDPERPPRKGIPSANGSNGWPIQKQLLNRVKMPALRSAVCAATAASRNSLSRGETQEPLLSSGESFIPQKPIERKMAVLPGAYFFAAARAGLFSSTSKKPIRSSAVGTKLVR
jgi:hypothetical protein